MSDPLSRVHGDHERLSDEELLAAHVQGDLQAFEHLVFRHRDRLWAVALRTTGDPEEAADALQDALISAFRRAEQFRGEAAVTTWLHRIVVNAALDRLRRRRIRQADPLPDDDSGALESFTSSEAIDQLELRMEIVRALAQLPEDQRAAVLLVDVEGLSVEEAARALGCPVGTIKSRCSRGRSRLAKLLAGVRNPDRATVVTEAKGGARGRRT